MGHEDLNQPSLPGVQGPPRQAIEYMDAVRRYYQPGVIRAPRNADIAAAHVPRLELRTWDRRKADLRNGKWGGRDWIEVWPPPPDWRPSWEMELLISRNGSVSPAAEDSDGVVYLTYEDTYDRNGKLIGRRLIRTMGHLGAVAAAVVFTVHCHHLVATLIQLGHVVN